MALKGKIHSKKDSNVSQNIILCVVEHEISSRSRNANVPVYECTRWLTELAGCSIRYDHFGGICVAMWAANWWPPTKMTTASGRVCVSACECVSVRLFSAFALHWHNYPLHLLSLVQSLESHLHRSTSHTRDTKTTRRNMVHETRASTWCGDVKKMERWL